jgi:hypothetical protein
MTHFDVSLEKQGLRYYCSGNMCNASSSYWIPIHTMQVLHCFEMYEHQNMAICKVLYACCQVGMLILTLAIPVAIQNSLYECVKENHMLHVCVCLYPHRGVTAGGRYLGFTLSVLCA